MSLLLASKRSYLEAEELARMQDNGRHALRLLSFELNMAGYLATRVQARPSIRSNPEVRPFDYLMRTNPPLEHVNDVTSAGLSGGGQSLPADCLLPGRHVAGSDMLLIRRTLSLPTVDPGGNLPASIRMRSTCARGPAMDRLVWQRAATASPRKVSCGSTYRRSCSCAIIGYQRRRRSPCAASVWGARQPHGAHRMPGGGAENLQVEFGIDEDGDQLADRFESVPDPAQLRAAVAARIYLLVRSVRPLGGYSDDRFYTLVTRGYDPRTVITGS